ncbi:amino acid carrier protein [Eubacterium sp. 14-2]|uniref:alanine/glycine:cation symporter family protein n=1 Tax=Eubacterium sp. 14-2 TaxID=1235790 RepID=UPI000336D6A6|nr:alanine/glycine:cation symporter family protein [Eubacterium sp. 14-2]EOT22593.1 amino acid carrier protein [Eubacterium sp. 14-2]
MSVESVLKTVDDLVWGIPLIVLILVVGIFLTVRLKGLQIRRLPLAIRNLVSDESSGQEGEVSGFGALCTALSATIGTGNIVGVATALVAGGPGALFWMVVAAVLGTVTKYAECMLAIKYRVTAEDGHVVGGPFYYIERGMGKNWKWLGKVFAFFGVGAGLLGIGTFTQINGITGAVNSFFDPNNQWTVSLFGREYSWTVVIAGVVLTVCVALVVIGGIQRISGVAQVLVPLMAATYITAALLILVFHASEIPAAFVTIVQSAFGMKAAAGGALGAMMTAMQKGVARGIFSNEAGLGSAPIAAAAVQTEEPAAQGLVSMLGTVIDTVIICTMTGLTIVITDTWNIGLDGVDVTTKAFQTGLPFAPAVSSFILMVCLVCFAFTTILGWNYYSEKCLEYLTGGSRQAVKTYRWVYILCVFIGPFMTVSAVWTIADIFNGLMAVPNLIAIIALNGVVAAETRQYLKKVDKWG